MVGIGGLFGTLPPESRSARRPRVESPPNALNASKAEESGASGWRGGSVDSSTSVSSSSDILNHYIFILSSLYISLLVSETTDKWCAKIQKYEGKQYTLTKLKNTGEKYHHRVKLTQYIIWRKYTFISF